MYKKFIPISLKKIIKHIIILNTAYKTYEHDAKRYLKYSNTENISDTEKKIIGKIIAKYHVIEKGLTMPNMRYGFGKDVIMSLIRDCNTYYKEYGQDNIQFRHSIGVLAEYKHEHEKNGKLIDNIVLQKINQLLSLVTKIKVTEQISTIKTNYFKDIYSSFDKFAESRHSLRNFDGNISIEILEKAINLAQNAPSACNRQPTRVYIIENKEKIKNLLKLQSGNRGFGHLADKLLILTSDVSGYGGIKERNLPYIDAGIYTMNLLYALHFYQLGACPLNWCDTPDIDRQIRTLINISSSEIVIICIACGGVPDNFKLTTSERNEINKIMTII